MDGRLRSAVFILIMPELPEIRNLSNQINAVLAGRTVNAFGCSNPKCLNMEIEQFCNMLIGRTIASSSSLGKWIWVNLDNEDRLMLCLGMGGEVLYSDSDKSPTQKRRALLTFTDKSSLAINFWWFGHIHYVKKGKPHKMSDELGIDPLSSDFTPDSLYSITSTRKARIKALLLNQRIIAGIGNFYIHDILFQAQIHPLMPSDSLSIQKVEALHRSIVDNLSKSLEKGGASYEQDLFGQYGGYDSTVIGYKEGVPCPVCAAPIHKIKTGSTSSFICPRCQTIE